MIRKMNTSVKKWLGSLGIVILLLPIIFMLLISIIGSISEEQFLMDYLITAELFFVIIVGSILTILFLDAWHYLLIFLLIMIISIIGIDIISSLSGIGDGTSPASGFWFVMIICLIVIYNIAYLLSIYVSIKNVLKALKKH